MILALLLMAQLAQLGVALPITYSQNYDPTLSPDGKRMIFLKMLEGHEQLFMADADGRNERQITRDPADKEDPAWSPDGREVAFVVLGAKNRLHVMRIDGSGDRQPIRHPARSAVAGSTAACRVACRSRHRVVVSGLESLRAGAVEDGVRS